MTFREAPGQFLDWLDTRSEVGFSNFLFIDQHFGSHPVLRRIFSLARQQGYRSLLLEKLDESSCGLLLEENEALSIRRPAFTGSEAIRLSFWRCAPWQPAEAESFIGYAICKTDSFSDSKPGRFVYEAVLTTARRKEQNNFVHCARIYDVQTQVGRQSVRGVLYAQQNDLTSVCAHVALRTALACLVPDADVTYAAMNRAIGVDHRSRRVGGGVGLSPPDLKAIIAQQGIACHELIHEPGHGLTLGTEFQRDLYGIIESGWPALVGFELGTPGSGQPSARHIVPIFGHSLNDDAWTPDAQRHYFGSQRSCFSSENWLSSYLLHDDNFGPYYCLPRHFLGRDQFRIMLGLKPHVTALNAHDAEAVGLEYMRWITQQIPATGCDWYDRFSIFSQAGLLVLRTLLVGRESYIEHLNQVASWNGTQIEGERIGRLRGMLPERFWMVEASAPELFAASRRKFGEILVCASSGLPQPLNLDLMIAVRLPGILLLRDSARVSSFQTRLDWHTPILVRDPA